LASFAFIGDGVVFSGSGSNFLDPDPDSDPTYLPTIFS
jgi:hypothetical protein